MSTAAAKVLGRKGGKVSSPAKTAACKKNAQKPRSKRVSEKGTWTARQSLTGEILVESDDKKHSAVFFLYGTFSDNSQKLRYAKMIAKRLNAKEKV